MRYPLVHRFQAALAIAASHSPPEPVSHWSQLVSWTPNLTPVIAQHPDPLWLNLALLPLILLHWDDQAALLRQLRPLLSNTLQSDLGAIALEGAMAVQQLAVVTLGEQPLNQDCLVSLVNPTFSHLAPYLSTVTAHRHSGAGLAQRQAILAPLASRYPQPEAHTAAVALTLSLYCAVTFPSQGQLACRWLRQGQAQAAAAIAGALCGLNQGLAGLSSTQYQQLNAPPESIPLSISQSIPQPTVPGASPAPQTTSLAALGQRLAALWAGAISPSIGTTAVAPPGILPL
ncbi:MAG: hypothetical protein AAF289_03340 [Cyanobacteria bacterium P01_A01_bin.135]